MDASYSAFIRNFIKNTSFEENEWVTFETPACLWRKKTLLAQIADRTLAVLHPNYLQKKSNLERDRKIQEIVNLRNRWHKNLSLELLLQCDEKIKRLIQWHSSGALDKSPIQWLVAFQTEILESQKLKAAEEWFAANRAGDQRKAESLTLQYNQLNREAKRQKILGPAILYYLSGLEKEGISCPRDVPPDFFIEEKISQIRDQIDWMAQYYDEKKYQWDDSLLAALNSSAESGLESHLSQVKDLHFERGAAREFFLILEIAALEHKQSTPASFKFFLEENLKNIETWKKTGEIPSHLSAAFSQAIQSSHQYLSSQSPFSRREDEVPAFMKRNRLLDKIADRQAREHEGRIVGKTSPLLLTPRSEENKRALRKALMDQNKAKYDPMIEWMYRSGKVSHTKETPSLREYFCILEFALSKGGESPLAEEDLRNYILRNSQGSSLFNIHIHNWKNHGLLPEEFYRFF